MKQSLEIIQTAMNLEKEGREYYRTAAKKTKDPKGKDFFLMLAKDEEEHMALFTMIYQSLREKGTWGSLPAGQLTKRKVQSTSIFNKKEAGETKADVGDIKAVEIAIGKEKNAIDFFSQSIDKVDEKDAKALLKELVEIEEGHLNLLKGELSALSDSGFWYDFQEFTVEGM